MALNHEWLSPTLAIGIVADSASLLACGWSCWNSHIKSVSYRPFAVLALLQFCLVLDMIFNWRWKLHDVGAQAAMFLGLYSLRRSPQLAALIILLLLFVCLAVLILRKVRPRIGLGLAASCTSLSLGLCFCESISYHYVDLVLYHFVGKVMVIALVWAGLASLTCLGVWIDSAAINRVGRTPQPTGAFR